MAPNPRKAKIRGAKAKTRRARRATKASSTVNRARSKSGSASRVRSTSGADATFTCPECGRTFTRAASLGAHRKQAHGVAGTSVSARANDSRARGKTKTANRRRGQASRPGSLAVDRNMLLRTLFPNGIPADEGVIRSVNSWLDEAERLAAAH